MNVWVARVPALVEACYPGQQGGAALADILFGNVNFDLSIQSKEWSGGGA